MKKGLTELVFVLERSGLFDDQYELLHNRINLIGITPISGN